MGGLVTAIQTVQVHPVPGRVQVSVAVAILGTVIDAETGAEGRATRPGTAGVDELFYLTFLWTEQASLG